jgi:hypothetical protein
MLYDVRHQVNLVFALHCCVVCGMLRVDVRLQQQQQQQTGIALLKTTGSKERKAMCCLQVTEHTGKQHMRCSTRQATHCASQLCCR